MKKLIDKAAVVTEIERRKKGLKDCHADTVAGYAGEISGLERLLSFLDTLEVKDANEALRTEYEKGKADVIADTLSWLENCWPKYCYNHTIIDAYKEGVVKD